MTIFRTIRYRQLSSGYWSISRGLNDWAQVPTWPPTEAELRAGMFHPGDESFVEAVMAMIAEANNP